MNDNTKITSIVGEPALNELHEMVSLLEKSIELKREFNNDTLSIKMKALDFARNHWQYVTANQPSYPTQAQCTPASIIDMANAVYVFLKGE